MPRNKKPRPHDPLAIAAKLDEIEAEMKAIGYWSPASAEPEDGDYQGAPLQFWLQFEFMPHAREATDKRKWPESSGVGLLAMRTWNYYEHFPETDRLVSLLHAFDYMVEHPEHFVIEAEKRKREREAK